MRDASARAEDVTHFLRNRTQGKRFLQERRFRVDDSAPYDLVIVIAAHEKHLERRASRAQLLEDFAAVHTGHDDVGDEDVDGAGMRLGECHGLVAAAGGKDGVAVLLERQPGQPSYTLFVLDEQDSLAAPGGRAWNPLSQAQVALFVRRQEHAEGGANGELALDHDEASSLLHDAIDGRQAKARPFSWSFRREERFEQMGPDI